MTDFYSLTVLEAGRLRAGCQRGQLLVRKLSLARRHPPSRYVLTWPSSVSAQAERERTLSSASYKATNPIRLGHHPYALRGENRFTVEG